LPALILFAATFAASDSANAPGSRPATVDRERRESSSKPVLPAPAAPALASAFSFAPNMLLGAPSDLAPNATSESQIRLAWTAPNGAVDHYQIERSQSLSGPFMVIGSSPNASFNDNTVSAVHCYLYRVRAIDSFGAPSQPSNMALATAITFEDPDLTAGVTRIRAQHIYDLRDAVNAVRAVAGLPAFTAWTTSSLETQPVHATDIQELRDNLGPALSALSITVAAYEDSTLATGPNGTSIRKRHIEQLRERSTRGESTNSGPPDGAVASAPARLDPMNRTGGGGEDPLSRNFNFAVGLVALPGRAGLDLGLSLSYNSLATWTHNGGYISFDDDFGFPAPGFHLGFATIQGAYYNAQSNCYSFLLITSSGARVELRQVNNSNLFQAVDSSYILLDAQTMTLKLPDGTQMSYLWEGHDYQCTQIKDRNGNFITVTYADNKIDTIVDTLARTIKFSYLNDDLNSITEYWTINGVQQSHTWAVFTYDNKIIQTSFTGVTVIGPSNGVFIRVLTRVTFLDNSHFDFDYTPWGQVWKVSQYGINDYLLNTRAYNLRGSPFLPTGSESECPRFTERHEWAANWNRDTQGNPQEAITGFAVTSSATIPDTSPALTGTLTQITMPDNTYQRIYFGSPATSQVWKNGLALLTESYDVTGPRQRWSTNTWTQDNESLAYQLNPRVTETNIYDSADNHARARVEYATFNLPDGTSCRYPQDSYEYAANGTTVVRRSHADYQMTATYTNRRILGLPSAKYICDGAQGEVSCNGSSGTSLVSKVTVEYDETGSIQGNDAPAQHDSNYGASLLAGRGNVSSVKRHNVVNVGQYTMNTMQYNTAGSVVKTTDAEGHFSQVSYTDAFAASGTTLDSGPPSTLAYPTTVTDADGYTANIRYNYQFGAVTWKRTPLPNVTDNQPGPQQKITYDAIGRLERTTNLVNNAYTRYAYGPNYVETFSTVNTVNDEAHSLRVFDGQGRVIAKAANHPGSAGGFSGQLVVYDAMGRVVRQYNPVETNLETISATAPLHPYAWAPTGDDDPTNGGYGWVYTQQTYDWKGRPRVTTNQDGTYKEASYRGCGCAGGEVVTVQDEGTVISNELKRRTQKVYSDVLGRAWKTEVLNWDGSVYSTTTTSLNARDQATLVRQYAGTDQSTTYQDTTTSFDGYGRLLAKHVPEQQDSNGNPTYTTWEYNNDDTLHRVTDARGVTATYGYNHNRHLVTGITYAVPQGSNIPVTTSVTFAYDAAGNRTSMTDGLGSQSYGYDSLSRMMSETRAFGSPLNQSYTLSYDYNLAGEVKTISDPWGGTINYGIDSVGRLSNITADGYGNLSTLVSNTQYRAWGSLESESFGNGLSDSAGYNTRMQLTSFDVRNASGAAQMSSTGQYYSNGQMKFSHNALDERFDRAFAYDHAARMTEAYSGSEARDFINNTNSGTPTGPYRQSYQFNPFSNLMQQVNRLWNDNETTSNTYLNNRVQGWIYDAAGFVTMNNDTSFSRDASGHIIAANGDVSSTAYSFDGDGRMLRKALTRPIFNGNHVTTTTYFLTSSVLKGLGVAEINSSGQKTSRYVYGGGRQLVREAFGELTWQHTNPISGGRGDSTPTGAYYANAEFNADGIDVGFSAPVENGFESGDFGGGGGYLGGGSGCSSADPNCVTCYLDGLETDCGHASFLMEMGAAEFHTPTTVYVTYTSGQVDTFSGYTNLAPGSYFNFTGDYAQMAAGAFGIVSGHAFSGLAGGFFHISGDFNAAVNASIEAANYLAGTRTDVSGHMFGFSPEPLKMSEVYNAQLNAQIQKMVADCIKELWKGYVTLTGYVYSRANNSGSANFQYGSNAQNATVRNDVTSYSGHALAQIYYQTGGKTPNVTFVRGLTTGGSISWTDLNGLGPQTLTFNAYTNYTANNIETTGSYYASTVAAFGDFAQNQIHELGNSIAAITGKDIGDANDAIDTDSGRRLSRCVDDKLPAGGHH